MRHARVGWRWAVSAFLDATSDLPHGSTAHLVRESETACGMRLAATIRHAAVVKSRQRCSDCTDSRSSDPFMSSIDRMLSSDARRRHRAELEKAAEARPRGMATKRQQISQRLPEWRPWPGKKAVGVVSIDDRYKDNEDPVGTRPGVPGLTHHPSCFRTPSSRQNGFDRTGPRCSPAVHDI
jgi:hypothetical protein